MSALRECVSIAFRQRRRLGVAVCRAQEFVHCFSASKQGPTSQGDVFTVQPGFPPTACRRIPSELKERRALSRAFCTAALWDVGACAAWSAGPLSRAGLAAACSLHHQQAIFEPSLLLCSLFVTESVALCRHALLGQGQHNHKAESCQWPSSFLVFWWQCCLSWVGSPLSTPASMVIPCRRLVSSCRCVQPQKLVPCCQAPFRAELATSS